jgi:hypothetical protein
VGGMTVFLKRYQESEEQLCGEKTKRPAQELGCLSMGFTWGCLDLGLGERGLVGLDSWALFKVGGLFESANQRSGRGYWFSGNNSGWLADCLKERQS